MGGYTLAARDISLEDKKNFRAMLKETMLTTLVAKTGIKREGIVIRDLLPSDVRLGQTGWATPPLVANAWNKWFVASVNQNQCIGIYRVTQLHFKPSISQIRFGNGVTIIGLHLLESCYSGFPTIEALAKALEDPVTREVLDRMLGRDEDPRVHPDFGAPMEAWFSQPYVYSPGDTIRIDVYAGNIAPDYLVLGGFVAEPQGMTI